MTSRLITRVYPGGARALADVGMLIKGRVSKPDAEATSFVDGYLLIDTGAGRSCIDANIAARLGLPLGESASIRTAAGPARAHVVDVVLSVQLDADPFGAREPLSYRRRALALPSLETNLVAAGSLLDAPLVALLGRDSLQPLRLVVDGPGGAFSIDFGEVIS